MIDCNVTLFIQATSRQSGALGIFQVYADESTLGRELDARVAIKRNCACLYPLLEKEIRYGWLCDADGRDIDEVMLARPVEGLRVLMTHGGAATREAVAAFLVNVGFGELSNWKDGVPDAVAVRDPLFQPILASCLTHTQLEAVLDAMQAAEDGDVEMIIPESLLRIRRVVMVGPPNAGKSSLLNQIVGFDRAFVHPEPGSTRDVVDELVDLGGYAVLLGDMPGFAGLDDGIGGTAWRKAGKRVQFAEALLFVVDGSLHWNAAAEATAEEVRSLLVAGGCGRVPVVVVLNKSDRPNAIVGKPWERHFPDATVVRVCSLPEGDAKECLDAVMAAILR